MNSTTTHNPVKGILERRPKRVFAPREAPESGNYYDLSEDSGWLLKNRQGCDGTTVTQEYWETPVATLLREKDRSGLWLPDWTRLSTPDTDARRMLAYILYCFDTDETASHLASRNGKRQETSEAYQERTNRFQRFNRRKAGRCRARAPRDLEVAWNGSTCPLRVFCLCHSLEQMGMAVGQTQRVARRVLTALSSRIVRVPDTQGVTIYPHGIQLAKDWLAYTGQKDADGDPVAICGSVELLTDWCNSPWRKEAMNRDGLARYNDADLDYNGYLATGKVTPAVTKIPVVPGVWVDDGLFAACDGRAGPAHILAHILYWQGRNWHTGKPKSPLVREGRRWTFLPDRELSHRLGYSPASIWEWRQWLVTKKFLTARKWTIAGLNSTENGVMHYTVNTDVLYQAMIAHQHHVAAWKAARLDREDKTALIATQKGVTVSGTGSDGFGH